MYDILIKNGKVLDGRGVAPYYADVAVTGDEIVKIEPNISEGAHREIDAKGKLVAPGFIDIHCHSDAIVFHDEKNPLRLRQGFTTEVIGNCGISAAPVNPKNLDLLSKYCAPFYSNVPVPYTWKTYKEYLDEMETHKPMLNTAGLVGHGTLRIAVAGFDARPLTEEEIRQINDLLAECMEGGAFGMSSGLIYPPGVFANADEMRSLLKTIKKYDGMYATHMRSESTELVEAVMENIALAEETGANIQLSHHKAQGIANKNKTKITLKLIREANERGLNVNCDVYPYDAASTQFSACLPPWALEGGVDKLVERVSDPKTRTEIIADMKKTPPAYENFLQYAGSWDRVLINECTVKKYEGKTIREIADERKADPYETALDVIKDSRNNVMMIVFTMSEEDISRTIYDPNSMICTDGFPGLGPYHPRYIAAFTRILEKYVKQEHLLSLSQAIYKMTGMPAAKLGLKNRGTLETGKKADILILDMEKIHDNSDYKNYNALSDGIDFVFINGQIAVDDGKFNNICAGKVLRKN